MTRGGDAQSRTYRIGYLGSSSDAASPNREALTGALDTLGYRVGRNLAVEYRFAEGLVERLPRLAAELVALRPDILFASGTQAALAASKATRTIPIVFVAVTDPDGLGIVKSLRRPGTNATGLSNQTDASQFKLLELAKEAFPAASEVAILYNPLNTYDGRTLSIMKQAAPALGLHLSPIETKAPADFVPAFQRLKARRPHVVYVMANPLTFQEREHIVALANGQRQAAVYGLSAFAEAGGLMSYSFSLIEQHRAAVSYIDKILKGADPATLPVEQPTRFELVLNLRVAKGLGISFPPALLARADRVLE